MFAPDFDTDAQVVHGHTAKNPQILQFRARYMVFGIWLRTCNSANQVEVVYESSPVLKWDRSHKPVVWEGLKRKHSSSDIICLGSFWWIFCENFSTPCPDIWFWWVNLCIWCFQRDRGLKCVKTYPPKLHTPQTLKLSRSTHNENVMVWRTCQGLSPCQGIHSPHCLGESYEPPGGANLCMQ